MRDRGWLWPGPDMRDRGWPWPLRRYFELTVGEDRPPGPGRVDPGECLAIGVSMTAASASPASNLSLHSAIVTPKTTFEGATAARSWPVLNEVG